MLKVKDKVEAKIEEETEKKGVKRFWCEATRAPVNT